MVTTGPLLTALYHHSNHSDDNNNTVIVVAADINEVIGVTGSADVNVTSVDISGLNTMTLSVTPHGSPPRHGWLHRMQVEELVIMAVIVCLWLLAVSSFLKQWASLRILQPAETRFLHRPKNLEHVQVVTRAQDSVIYNNYSRKMSLTMVAREQKHLQRLTSGPFLEELALLPAIETQTSPTSDCATPGD